MSQRIPGSVLFPIIVVALVMLAGCGGRTGASGPANPKSASDKKIQINETTVSTVTELDGELLVELPIGSATLVKPADFFHIHANDEARRLKGTVMVAEILGPNRCLAKLAGDLLDRNVPIVAGDSATYLHNLTSISALDRLEDKLEAQAEAAAENDERNRSVHDRIRASYERRLKTLRERHQAILEQRAAEFAAELARIQGGHKRQVDRTASRHEAELTALRAALADEAKEALREERKAIQRDLDAHRTENTTLANKIASLIEDQRLARDKLIAIEARRAQAEELHRGELLAEAETRAVLEERIAQLEALLAGKVRSAKQILPHDPERNETILERLDRVAGERDQALTQARDLDGRLQRLQQANEELGTRLQQLNQQVSSGAIAGPELTKLQDEVTALAVTARTYEEAQLKTERAYYALAVRILQLPDTDPAVRDLQKRLHERLNPTGKKP